MFIRSSSRAAAIPERHIIPVRRNPESQAAYVAGWLKKLRDDRKLLIHAAAQAQHAADYILRAPRTV
jgi:antirestriction protein ArdC